MQTTAILFTKVENISTYQNCIYSEPLLLCSPDMSIMKLLTVTNTARLTLKIELINWRGLMVNHFLMAVWKFSPKTHRRNIIASSFSLPPFLIHSTSALPCSLQLCPGCYQLITVRYYT